ncbi:cobalamin biosynthesis protein [Oceanicola sp. 22II-s10i]|uniref:cobalamin biosynthesis protein n=1 Tax=Oceanicola sp. 22II-s10i TaxID=1317116 RepID=UPI0011315D70|nr:cobalamin biosynthesis protein [Oceanicola sp. 22II-s10i]
MQRLAAVWFRGAGAVGSGPAPALRGMRAMTVPVVLALSGRGATVGRLIATSLGVPLWARAEGDAGGDHTFADASAFVRRVRAEGRPVVAVCASGMLHDLMGGPMPGMVSGVVAVSHDGTVVTQLQGMSEGLAERVGLALSGAGAGRHPDGDPRHWLEDPPEGWTLGTPALAAPVRARLMAGGLARIDGDEAIRADWLADLPAASPPDEGLRDVVGIEATTMPPVDGVLTYHPQRFALGICCAGDCPPAELEAQVRQMLEDSETAPGAVKAILTDAGSCRAAAVVALADRLRLPLRVCAEPYAGDPADRRAVAVASPSPVAGRAAISQTAALFGAGSRARLGLPTVSADLFACALAVAPDAIAGLRGRPA